MSSFLWLMVLIAAACANDGGGENGAGTIGESGSTANATDADSQGDSSGSESGSGEIGWHRVAVGMWHACGITTDGMLWCWGDNGNGQLGVPDLESASTPARVGTRTDWQDVWASGRYACARASDGIWCWGNDHLGQVAAGTVSSDLVPSPVLTLVPGDAVALALGTYHACARLADGGLWCWGDRMGGQGVGGGVEPTGTPLQVPLAAGASDHGVGSHHTCALTDGLGVFCWGVGVEGQLGTGQAENQATPTAAFSGIEVTQIALVAFQRTCVRDASGRTHCAGRNAQAQLGTGSSEPDTVVDPRAVETLDGLTLVGGIQHTCGLRDDGALLCWGGNEHGQVGDGTTDLRTTPTPVGEPSWTSIAAGSTNTCAIDVDARLWCWGDNERGQVGDGSMDAIRPEPSEVIGGAT